ncbi:MAG: Ig-like domain-containing protein, partial [Oscillospiraceae bacterium]|nr:Ig-like domain-containing protein [Oscillospiraceae bacterium]
LMKHASPWTQEGFDFIPRIHTVLDNMLYGIANEGLDAFPNVIIHNNDTLEYEEHENWPINDRYQKFYPTGSDRVGSLSINKPKQIELLDFVEEKALTLVRPVVTATSNPQMAAAQYTTWKHNLIGGSDTALSTDAPFNILPNQDRLVYTVDISEDTRISGYIKMTAKIASDKKVGGISAMLVDYGAANYVHRTFASAGTVGSTTNVNSVQNWPAGSSASGTWGANTTNLTVLNKNTAIDPWNIISRGHVSVQKPNYNGNIWVDAPNTNYIPEFYYQTTVIEPGKFYPYTWELNVMDYTIKAGHKLGLILYSTDPEHIQRPLTNPTTFTVEIGQDTYLSLPIVGEFVTSEVPDVLVTGVTLAPGAVSLNVGSTRQLTQTVAPANATDQSVTWSSTNTAAATVSNTGEVAALAAGTATITVTTNDGGFVASCDVTVTTTVSVDSVTVAPKTASITVGGTQQLTETVLPSTATIKTVTWSSSNSAVATVSNAGLVTAVSAGTATITVTAVDDATKSDTCAVTVTSVPVTGVSVTPTSVTVVKGDTRALSAAVAPSNATNQVVTWSSGNAAVATVSNTGVVTAVAAGTATITVRTNDGGFEDTCVITVPPSIAPVDPTYPSDLNAVADDTGIAASDLETKDGKVYLKKGLAEVIAKALLNAGSVNTTVQPVFEGTVAPDGQIAQLTFTMTGKDLLASFADEINLIGLVSGISGKRFSYTDNAADYDDGKFTLLSGGAIFSGEIDPNATYQLVAFIQDGGEFDLDGATNGEFIASVFIASEKTGGGGGGCSTFGYLAFAILALPFLLKRKS